MKIGFIGCGNMATAMIKGILGKGMEAPENICASAKSEKTRTKIREELQIGVATNEEVAAGADVLFLAVKPQFYEEVIAQIRSCVKETAVVVSIAPGKTLAWLAEQFGKNMKFVRVMPNTPAMVGEGMSGFCTGELVTEEETRQVRAILESFGRAEQVPERLMDTVSGVSGSSPAWIFMIIEAMADAAVADGMPRAQAYSFAAQTVLGSARLVLESGQHPGALKDMVCSPGGTTIEAVGVLESKGLRGALFEAQRACVRKARGM
ncbi:MAG: pyrroline-5-carboxylate reductase [Lachnospiraceae bacterium]|nr:pyrroline-5-carboxylate reductase [Lachnospiraceae bacterium]